MNKPLADHGIASVTVPLPSCGETSGDLGDLYDDVSACKRAIAEIDGPVVLLGHSYGGVIITEAGVDDRVTQLLYVTSVMPEAGQTQTEIIGSAPPRRTSCARRTSLRPPRFNVNASKQTLDSSTFPPGTTRFSRSPTRWPRASPARSTSSADPTTSLTQNPIRARRRRARHRSRDLAGRPARRPRCPCRGRSEKASRTDFCRFTGCRFVAAAATTPTLLLSSSIEPKEKCVSPPLAAAGMPISWFMQHGSYRLRPAHVAPSPDLRKPA
jgi:pimeloyl-ACP methyl ester carboxylesterase